MKVITIAFLGLYLLLVTYGVPISPILDDSMPATNLDEITSEQIGDGSDHLKSPAYSGDLSSSSGLFQRVDGYDDEYYYFDAIQVTVSTSGTYTFTSDSELDTMGYLYDTTFDPSDPTTNLITYDDDGGDSYLQFEVEAFLQTGHTYVLVVTTHREYETGSFSVSVGGPSTVNLVSIIPTTSRPMTIPTTVPLQSTSYTGELSANSGIYQRVDGDEEEYYYFDAIEITAPTTGTYIFTSDSDLDTMGYLYDTTFDPSDPTVNLITYDDDSGDVSLQFEIEAFLHVGQKYVLVVTTHREYEKGSFTVLIRGEEPVNPISIIPTTSRPMTIPTTIPTTSSSYSSELSTGSGLFQRVDGYDDEYYYFDAIQVTAFISGTYTFTSDSELDTMGYLYDTTFDPSDPTTNLITYDDDGGDNYLQFEVEAFLQAGHTYVLVVTTHREYETGSFSMSVSGPESVNLVAIIPTTSRPMTIPTTLPMISSSYSNELSSNSLTFHRPDGDTELNYYYHAIKVTVTTAGTYTFTSDSKLDTMGYFYDGSFDPSNPTVNLITYDDDMGDIHLQFEIEVFLQPGHTYILVVTTHTEAETGNFSVSSKGPDNVVFTPSTK